MDRSGLKKIAAAAVSMALFGCASAPSGKDATFLSGLFGNPAAPSEARKDTAPNGKAPAAPAGKPAPPDLDGAIRQAEELRKTGDLAGASRTLSQLVLVAPDDARVLGEYGKTLLAQGRSDDALAFLTRAIELQPGEWSLFSAQGIAYDQKGEYQPAQAAYGRALALKPGDATVLSNNALSHLQSGDLDSAERMLLQAQQNGGANPRIASNLALVRSLKAARLQPMPVEAMASSPAPSSAQAEDRPAAPNPIALEPAIAPEAAKIEQPKPGSVPVVQSGPKTIAPPPSLRRARADVSQSLSSSER